MFFYFLGGGDNIIIYNTHTAIHFMIMNIITLNVYVFVVCLQKYCEAYNNLINKPQQKWIMINSRA